MRVVSSEEIKKIESTCFECLPSRSIMEIAGRAVVQQVLDNFSEVRKVIIFAGSGNNGGDGFVIARVLLDLGLEVYVYLAGDVKKFSADTAANFSLLGREKFITEVDHQFDLIVDAVLGTGAKGAARSEALDAINKINYLSKTFEIPVIAVDIPSGVDPDTGEIGSEAVNADLTVSFQYPKWGNILQPGKIKNGELIIADIGLGSSMLGADLLDLYSFNTINIARDAHKGTKGHIVIIGGARGKTGSIKLSGMAALKAYSGLVTLAVPEDQISIFASALLEQMSAALPSDGAGNFIEANDQQIKEVIKDKDAIVIGPGMGTDKKASILLKRLIENLKTTEIKIPVVLDADALTLLAQIDIKLCEYFVLTPHPGEMAKLLGSDVLQVQQDRRKAVVELSKKFNCWSILKGAQSLISSPDGALTVCSYSCPALATAGSGDVLAGLLASFLGAKYSFGDSCSLAVYIHACAGLILEDSQLGALGSTASDIVEIIPLVVNSLPDFKPAMLFQYIGEQAYLDYFLSESR